MRKILCFLFAAFAAGLVSAEKLPDSLRGKTKEYPSAIAKDVNSLNRKKLLDDSYFISALKKEVTNPKHSEEDKVYYFYLMLNQIRWGFSGAVWMRPDGHYTDEVIFQCASLLSYREELKKLGLDTSPYYKLALESGNEKPILASYSLLLATLLETDDKKALSEISKKAEALLPQAAFPLRSMLIHNICYSLLLIKDENELPFVSYITYYAVLEEEKEDLVIAGALSNNEQDVQWVFQTLIQINDSSEDLLARICMYVLNNMLSETSFKTMLETYKSHAENDFQKKLADDIAENGNKVPYLGPYWEGQKGLFTKFWDFENVLFTFYDDGLYISSGNFSEFIPN